MFLAKQNINLVLLCINISKLKVNIFIGSLDTRFKVSEAGWLGTFDLVVEFTDMANPSAD